MKFKIILMLFLGLAYHTHFFKLLPPNLNEPICLLILLLILLKTRLVFKNYWLNQFLFTTVFFSAILITLGIFENDIYAIIAAYRIMIAAVYAATLYSICKEDAKYNPEISMRLFAKCMMWLVVANLTAFIASQVLFIEHFFEIKIGTIEPRTYLHYGLAAPEEVDRFISFFNEPSDFIWITGAAGFIWLSLKSKTKSWLIYIFQIASFSGSLIIIWILKIVYLVNKIKLKYTIFFVPVIIFSAITPIQNINYNLDDAGLFSKVLLRYTTSSGDIQISRLQETRGVINDFQIYPQKIEGEDLLLYGNTLKYSIVRAGVFSFIYLISLLIILTLVVKSAFNRNIETLYAIICFILMNFAKESINTSLLFWFIAIPLIETGKVKNDQSRN